MYCRSLGLRLNNGTVRSHLSIVTRQGSSRAPGNDETICDQELHQTSSVEDGPSLADFIGGVVPRGSTWKEYQGKLRREKGENER